MISEIDIRDWERVDFKKLEAALETVNDSITVFDEEKTDPYMEVNYLQEFIKQMELLRDKQVQLATKHIAAVEKKGFHG